MSPKAIGIFDSGIGGLTVAKSVAELLPNERIIYLGDTARVPYGTRGPEVITKFALQMTSYLLKRDVKFLVVACNTISATCLDQIQLASPVPVLGVVLPAAQEIVELTKTKKVAVVGTRATIQSQAYEQAIHSIDPSIEVRSKACPLFVPLAEEGLGDSPIAKLAAENYLSELKDIDVLHLGCTHYPLLTNVIQNVVGNSVSIIDSASPTAKELKVQLTKMDLLAEKATGDNEFLFTDSPVRVIEAAGLFYGSDLADKIKKIELFD